MKSRIYFAMILLAIGMFIFSCAPKHESAQDVTVTLTDKGFEPSSFTLTQGVTAKITFVRKVDGLCAKLVRMPEFNIERELPLNTPVTVEVTPDKTGEFGFACGMNMIKGKVLVTAG